MSVLGGRFAVACIVALGLGSARAFVVGFSKHPLKILQTTRPFATATTKEQQPTRVDETYYWPYRTKAGHTQQFRINYRVVQDDDTENTKQPLLLVHGFGANLGHFRYQYDELVAAGYKVYAIDLLGFGASEKPPNAVRCVCCYRAASALLSGSYVSHTARCFLLFINNTTTTTKIGRRWLFRRALCAASSGLYEFP